VSDALSNADEQPHTPGDDPLWNESWYMDWASRDGSLGGYVRIGLYPNLNRVWYWACLVGEGRPLVTVIDHDVRLPVRPSLEIRGDGLWADHTVEKPFDHFTLGCEAFGLALDDPAETYGDMRGERTPLGLDLEWDTVGDGAYVWPGATRYEIPCDVHGEILLGDERIEFDGIGQRDHSWGVRDWWRFGWVWTAGGLSDGTRFHTTRVRIPETAGFAPGYVQAPDGTRTQIDRCDATEDVDAAGLPETASVTVGSLEMTIEPVAFSPVLLAAEDGRLSRFPRALCRFRNADGRSGVGWTEWNQPQAPS
jgi:hypothetical protein